MIATSELAPSPFLASFVCCYAYREFDTGGVDFVKPKHAAHEIAMHFFFKGIPLTLADPATGRILKTGKRSGVSGLSSQYVGEMTFNGFYSFFEITFTPFGFYTLFGIPSGELLNQIAWSEEIFDKSVDAFYEQLCDASNIAGMAAMTDAYLLSRLGRLKWVDKQNSIAAAVHLINWDRGLINIDRLAQYVNMSARNFERYFYQQVGIPPKLYCCIRRFNHALNVKLRNPGTEWTSIAHQTGYYDQMHLIKDFKRFAGEAPSALLRETPLLIEHYSSRV